MCVDRGVRECVRVTIIKLTNHHTQTFNNVNIYRTNTSWPLIPALWRHTSANQREAKLINKTKKGLLFLSQNSTERELARSAQLTSFTNTVLKLWPKINSLCCSFRRIDHSNLDQFVRWCYKVAIVVVVVVVVSIVVVDVIVIIVVVVVLLLSRSVNWF